MLNIETAAAKLQKEVSLAHIDYCNLRWCEIYFKRGDIKSLAGHVESMDTCQRDRLPDEIIQLIEDYYAEGTVK